MEPAARAYFLASRAFGRLLRAGKYADAGLAEEGGGREVRKRRRFYAPLLVWLGGPLVRILDTGGRVLGQREWEAREREIYRALCSLEIRSEGATLLLPRLPGKPLAAWLEDPGLAESDRRRAIALAVAALADFHRRGLTHGDAMAENVLVDLDRDAAHWIDFETLHDPARPLAWRRADDLRALLVTCLLRTPPPELARVIELVLSTYGDETVSRRVAASFRSVWRRALSFHLAQAPLSYAKFRDIGRLLDARSGG